MATILPKSLFGYDVLDYIGEGAGSQIYAVSDPASRQLYAFKHVVRKSDKDIRFVEQLETEYEVGSTVQHPGLRKSIALKYERTLLRRVTEAGLVLELVDGRALEFAMPETLKGILKAFTGTAAALAALHEGGYVHCDLKPNNIMIDAQGRIKVIDLGQAVRAGTIKERIQGTPDYISPEQVRREPVTVRTDVFNLGATLYWALSGKKLPTLFNLAKSENSLLSDDLMQSPRQLNPAIPEPLSNMVMECVRSNPLKRPESMTLVRHRLEIIYHGLTHASSMKRRPNSDSSMVASVP